MRTKKHCLFLTRKSKYRFFNFFYVTFNSPTARGADLHPSAWCEWQPWWRTRRRCPTRDCYKAASTSETLCILIKSPNVPRSALYRFLTTSLARNGRNSQNTPNKVSVVAQGWFCSVSEVFGDAAEHSARPQSAMSGPRARTGPCIVFWLPAEGWADGGYHQYTRNTTTHERSRTYSRDN